jgi:DNA-binding protein HU-beta
VNKAELVEAVRKTLGQVCSRAHAEQCVNAVVESISRGLKKDKAVHLVGFGTFSVKNRKGRRIRDPRTGEEMRLPPHKTIGFKAGTRLKKKI